MTKTYGEVLAPNTDRRSVSQALRMTRFGHDVALEEDGEIPAWLIAQETILEATLNKWNQPIHE